MVYYKVRCVSVSAHVNGEWQRQFLQNVPGRKPLEVSTQTWMGSDGVSGLSKANRTFAIIHLPGEKITRLGVFSLIIVL